MPISIQLSSETEQRLDFLVTHTGRSKADCLREIIENGIEDLEDYYLAADAARNPGRSYSAEEVKRELGL